LIALDELQPFAIVTVIHGEADEPGAAFDGFRQQLDAFGSAEMTVEQIWISTMRDAKIAEIRAVSDRLGMFLQLGWDWPETD